MKKLIHHAYYNTVYYRNLFDRWKIKPSDVNDENDLINIPITIRKNIQSLPKEDILNKNEDIAGCRIVRTSGSTGEPFSIYRGKYDRERRLPYIRMYASNRCRFNDKMLIITTQQNFSKSGYFRTKSSFFRRKREKYLSLEKGIDYLLDEMRSYKCDILIGYVSVIREITQEIKRRNIKNIHPRVIFLTGEMLSKKDRGFISSVFNGEVFDYYSCSECGIIAWECREHNGYHVDADNVIVELVKDDKSVCVGEEGKVIITCLNSYTMPFIRYELGDVCILSDKKCPCGIGFPVLKLIAGRSNDYIVLPDGRRISPYLMMATMDKIKRVIKYRIVQETIDKIRIKIMVDSYFSQEEINAIRLDYEKIMGKDISIEIDLCKEIEKNSVYKKHVIISCLNRSNIKESNNDN
ncbi:MAG: phenylacetate--CoA ligase family protein [Candidatus Omnitrophica bacterium]|nr:phenylacetate--CoA ligase family protein [Candidatus Omnitrophota bacterium]